MLHFYVGVGLTALRRQLVYRWANIAGLCTNIFFGLVFSYVIIALYQARPSVSGYDVRDALRYTWLMQTLLMVVLPFNWIDLMQTIRTGDVISDLSKPFDFCTYWFSRELGRSFYFLVYRGIPIYLAGIVIFNLGFPTEWQVLVSFVVSLLLGTVLGVIYRFLYNIVAFWIVEAKAMVTFCVVIAQFCAGMYVPLPLLPSWLRSTFELLPFASFMNTPAEIFLEKVSWIGIIVLLMRQALWVVILLLCAHLLTALASQRVIAQGG